MNAAALGSVFEAWLVRPKLDQRSIALSPKSRLAPIFWRFRNNDLHSANAPRETNDDPCATPFGNDALLVDFVAAFFNAC